MKKEKKMKEMKKWRETNRRTDENMHVTNGFWD